MNVSANRAIKMLRQTAFATGGYERRVLTSWNDLTALAAAWQDLHSRSCATIFSSLPWMQAQQSNFGSAGRPHIVTLWRHGALVAAAPLVMAPMPISKRIGFYRPQTLGGFTCQYTGHLDFPAQDTAAQAALADALADVACGTALDLKLLREGQMRDRLLEAFARRGIAPIEDLQFQSTVVDAQAAWKTHVASLNASVRKSLRKTDRLHATDGVEISIFRTGPESLLDRVFNVAERSWKHKTLTSVASSPQTRAFALSMWRALAPSHDVVVTLLSLKGIDFASCVMFRCHGRWIGIWTDFDESYADYAPGRTGICRSFEAVMGQGDYDIDMMRRTHFTSAFSDQTYQISRIRAFPRNSPARWLVAGEEIAARMLRPLRSGSRGSKLRRNDAIKS